MKPAEIIQSILGQEKLSTIIESLSSIQIKAVLKEGGARLRLPGGYVNQQARRRRWLEKILKEIEQNNDKLGEELLRQWLLNHRREMLIEYLDHLEVIHRQGETDKAFLVDNPREKILSAARWLLGRHDRQEVEAYLRYIAFQQHTDVFMGWDGFLPMNDQGVTSLQIGSSLP